MDINNEGCTRIVLLTKKYAFKIPQVTKGWSMFLHGLLANLQENALGSSGYKGFCPVVFYLPFGLLSVMKKARIFSVNDFNEFDYESFCCRDGYKIPAELKRDSFGWLDGEIVAVDYS